MVNYWRFVTFLAYLKLGIWGIVVTRFHPIEGVFAGFILVMWLIFTTSRVTIAKGHSKIGKPLDR